MDAAYGARYRRLYEQHWWWRAREAMILRLLRGLTPASGFGDILDIGCGDGLLLPALRRFGRPQGLEADAALVTDHGRAQGPIFVGPFDEDFQPRERFGLIVMLDVLEHLDDDVAALRHIEHLLAPGGVLVVTVPAFRALWTTHDDYNHHRTRYTRASFRGASSSTDLRIEQLRYFFHWLAPLKVATRIKERWVRDQQPQMPEVPPTAVNKTCEALSRLEQTTWGRLPLPFGSSLLAVCRAG